MTDRLIGRSVEQAAIGGLLDAAASQGGVLILRGAPGVGKSALLDWAAQSARHAMLVIRATGSPAETGLPFAAVHQVLRPLRSYLSALPDHRRGTLNAVFGIPTDAAPDLYAIALATLDVLAEAAVDRPLLVLIDDAQWMDPASQLVFAFVARRVGVDRVVLLVTHRPDEPGPLLDRTLPLADVGALDTKAAEAILDRDEAGLDARSRTAVLALAQGNPLALQELPRTVSATAQPEHDPVPLTQRLETSFAARVCGLSWLTRNALDVAAVSDSDEVAEIAQASAVLIAGATIGVLDEAVAAGLVEVTERTWRFYHPLIRSCIYQQMGADRRRVVHDALAQVLRDQPERAVWHRSAAALQPDAQLAADLERTAELAIGRGAPINAVRALERAAQLSPTAQRGDRLFRAAMLAHALGQADSGGRLAGEYRDWTTTERDQLRYEWLVELGLGDHGGDRRVSLLVALAGRAHRINDAELVVRFLRAAALRCWNFCPDPSVGQEVVQAADRLVPTADRVSRARLLAYGAPLVRAQDVITLVRQVTGADRDATTAFELGHAAACVGAFDLSEGLFTEAVQKLRVEGRLHTLATALVLLAWSALRRGQWSTAVSATEEGGRLCEETDQPFWRACAYAGQAVVLALRGYSHEAEVLIDKAEIVAAPHGFAAAAAVIVVARATAAASQGQHELAFHHLRRLHDRQDPARHPIHGLWSLAAMAEAAAISGHTAAARGIVAHLREDARATSSPAGRMNLMYADAVLAPEDEIEDRLGAAVQADLTIWPLERSRLLLTYGSLLRRRQRVRDSREFLRAALDGFNRLGAKPWADRAREELRAAGERNHTATADVWDTLSPQELQIATLVATGLSNRDIGERLFLSHRTVGSHLYRIFPKLGISSRVELLQMVTQRPPTLLSNGN